MKLDNRILVIYQANEFVCITLSSKLNFIIYCLHFYLIIDNKMKLLLFGIYLYFLVSASNQKVSILEQVSSSEIAPTRASSCNTQNTRNTRNKKADID